MAEFLLVRKAESLSPNIYLRNFVLIGPWVG